MVERKRMRHRDREIDNLFELGKQMLTLLPQLEHQFLAFIEPETLENIKKEEPLHPLGLHFKLSGLKVKEKTRDLLQSCSSSQSSKSIFKSRVAEILAFGRTKDFETPTLRLSATTKSPISHH